MNEKRLILVIEDEHAISNFICRALAANDYKAIPASSGKEGLSLFFSHSPDLVLLDLGLPDMDGLEVLEQLSDLPREVPVIIISARDRESEKVRALDMGADDYVVKPFDLAVLYSRILALLRRTKTITDTKLFCDDLMLDKEKTAVYDGQKEIVVSQPEYRILLILMENKGKTITRNQLLEQVWDRSGNYVNDNTLTVTMKRLREKLNHPACLKTIRSFGYRMEDTQ